MSGGPRTLQMATLIREHMRSIGVTQAELARRIGRSEKHISQVFNGKSGTMELDYWAYCLGVEFCVTLRPVSSPSEPTPDGDG